MRDMAYKALGWTVWQGVKLYLRRRFGGLVTRRRVLVAGGAVAVVTCVAVAGLRASHER